MNWTPRHPVSSQVVINNAGVYGAKINLKTVTAEDMLFTYRANTIGPLLIVQQLLKNKLIGKPGSIVGNVTSKVPDDHTCLVNWKTHCHFQHLHFQSNPLEGGEREG